MKKINRIIFMGLISIMGMLSFSSCGGLIENGDINKFTGAYISGTGTETVKHYYWGNTTIKSERTILNSGCSIWIFKNKKVKFSFPNSETVVEGRVRVFTDYVTFSNISAINSSYKFELLSDHSLAYHYTEDKYGLEYDFTTRHIPLNYQGEVDDDGPISIVDKGYIKIERKTETYEVTDESNVFRGCSAHFTIKGKDINGNDLNPSETPVRWLSTNTDVARVSSDGTVEPQKEGKTVLRATLGNYFDEIELNSAIIATTFELTELPDEYRADYSYKMPLSVSPYNATVNYSTTDSSVVKISDDFKSFSILKGGKAKINIEAYIDVSGQKETLTIDINALNKDAPHFEHENRMMSKATISVAKNKFAMLKPAELDIHAYTSSGVDITSQIEIYSGLYDLAAIGTYDVVLSVTDDNDTAFFYLTLEVIEFETVKTDSMFVADGIVTQGSTYKFATDPYSQAIKSIEFKMNIKLNSSYDAADLTINWHINFKIKYWDQNTWVDYTKTPLNVEEYSFAKGGPTSLQMTWTYTNPNYLDPSTFTGLEMYAIGTGTYYQYIYY